MKFVLAFKTPDVLDPALDTVRAVGCGAPECGDDGSPGCCIDCERMEDNAREDAMEIRNTAELFVEYGEYIRIEFDTDTKTATVLKVQPF
jgi:hypothetical protein